MGPTILQSLSMKHSLFKIFFLCLALMLLVSVSVQATHLRAGEITVRRDACNNLKFYITVTVFTNTINTNVLFGGDDDILDFGDGSDPDGDGKIGILVPETQNTLRPDLGEGIATASFEVTHIYGAGSSFTISYSEPNRNEGVVNMDGSVNTRFYIETQIIVDPFFGCNEYSPKLEVPPIDKGCTGVAWFHNPGAYDLDGDSLSYELVIPFRDRNTTVVNYKDPNNPKFYSNFQTGNEEGLGPPTFSINSVDGTITWDAPGAAGEYNIAFIIKEWRRVSGEWVQMGYVRRDMQIIIEDCMNNRPDLIVPEDVCIEAGDSLDVTIVGTDPDNDQVKIEAFSEIFQFANSKATFRPDPAAYAPQPAEGKFHWVTNCEHVKEQPYQVVFKVTDNSTQGAKLVTFKTWLIRVVGPKPKWLDDPAEAIKPDLSKRSVELNWQNYFCADNAERIQIWRRVDSLAFEPDFCETGMPENLGYQLIKELPITPNGPTTYVDDNHGKGLAAATVYCYRLVAIFPKPRGGESPVSAEVCIPAILADSPIITNVTVDKTGSTDGQITVRWVAPFDADPAQFPPPYTYEVYRAEGFSGNGGLTKVQGTVNSDLSFVDSGINTEAKVFNYRIFATASNGALLDTSAIASSVRLEAQSELNKIDLSWSADVPWSNQVPGLKHNIYRGDEGATSISDLTLIDAVEVLGEGFVYPDEGQFNQVPLEPGKVYCYAVETLGSYGNDKPEIPDPLHNFSQIVCTQPGDETPPCKPETPIPDQPRDCAAYVADVSTCNNNVFSNVIKWNRASDDCGKDIAFYRIYTAASADIEFLLFAEVRDTVFVDENLPSFAKCYKISAVDRSGNESELSDPVCLDNCPYYELPNVFSPNNDKCNDLFSAYNNRDTSGESGEENVCITPETSKEKCARFVDDVTFKVYNRWGKQVYSYTTVGTAGDKTIYIDWNGRASDGSDLAAGVYYYIAQVKFNSVDPSKQNQTIKGWVQLVK
jgi:hypothetical protein